jgi:hypothetical protein
MCLAFGYASGAYLYYAQPVVQRGCGAGIDLSLYLSDYGLYFLFYVLLYGAVYFPCRYVCVCADNAAALFGKRRGRVNCPGFSYHDKIRLFSRPKIFV